MHQKFPKKEKKLILVGNPDSGKTSWFCPFEGIIPSSFISYIVPDGRFSAADITSNTQVVVMDEWTPESLSCEDAKRILQGGRITVPRKHSSVQSTHYNSGFFITTNDFPDFGAGRDGEAIKKRLQVFNTVSLKRKDPTISAWLRRNCMEIFHWVAEQLHDMPLFSIVQEIEERTGVIYNDFDSENPFKSDVEEPLNYSFSQPSSSSSSAPAASAATSSSSATGSNRDRRNVENVLDHTFYTVSTAQNHIFTLCRRIEILFIAQ
ncbi:uncharacterized protein [Clytia hemisphaerica]